ncbi:hypothetical protein JAAARDRAFT_50305 [Jaapia argillacea MUCL 33604]|uniref:Uncharacterized protein n=1 Tax=Jaapia argillacea MUCL 33604 TaxID=933084 RepID=A0A067PM84_9AGAM|nr:hypothetical protein JAAARDRAFT_50305 [Jaapia argillacea MUCL 33604]
MARILVGVEPFCGEEGADRVNKVLLREWLSVRHGEKRGFRRGRVAVEDIPHENVSFGGWQSEEQMRGICDVRDELDGALREIHGDGDGEFRVLIFLAMETFDPSDKSLDDWGFCCFEWKIRVDVEGVNVGEVEFNGFGLDSASERSNPGHDSRLGCWKEGPVAVAKLVEHDKVEIGFLTNRVGFPGAGGEAMPEVKGYEARVYNVGPLKGITPSSNSLNNGVQLIELDIPFMEVTRDSGCEPLTAKDSTNALGATGIGVDVQDGMVRSNKADAIPPFCEL